MKALLAYLTILGFVVGLAAVVAGVYLEFGLSWSLMVGGAALVAGCLLVDV